MHIRLMIAALLLTGAVCLADDAADRAKLGGTWNVDGGTAKTAWTLQGTDTGVHVIYTRGAEKLADFECTTSGKECATKIDGRATKVSIYFNGPKLVLLETRGDNVVKLRFSLASEPSEMEVETMPISPAGKAETQRFKRVDVQASSR
jgi:hypothetical protein